MPALLEIEAEDIGQLDDGALRTLIGLLCEADYRHEGLSTSGITWGGNQDAPDGGFDVVVAGDDGPPKAGFVPRKHSAFQVKRPNMAAAAITREMRPKGP